MDYLNLTEGEQQVLSNAHETHARACEDCEAANWAHARNWEEQPTIVCLCGSLKFLTAYRKARLHESNVGNIVLTVEADMPDEQAYYDAFPDDERMRLRTVLIERHYRQLDLCDEALFLNVGGYIGEDTARELAYARERGKVIRFLEPEVTDGPDAKTGTRADSTDG